MARIVPTDRLSRHAAGGRNTICRRHDRLLQRAVGRSFEASPIPNGRSCACGTSSPARVVRLQRTCCPRVRSALPRRIVFKRSDGTSVPVFLTFSALPADCGAAIGLLITDLTTEKYHQELAEAHEALRKSEDALSTKERQLLHITDNTSVLIAQCSRDLPVRLCEQGVRPVSGTLGRRDCRKTRFEVMGQEPSTPSILTSRGCSMANGWSIEAEVPYARIGVRHMRVSYVPDFGVTGKHLRLDRLHYRYHRSQADRRSVTRQRSASFNIPRTASCWRWRRRPRRPLDNP